MKHRIVFTIFLSLLVCSGLAIGAEYSRNVDFGPVRFTVEQVVQLSDDLFNYILSVNSPSNETSGEVSFKSDRYSATLNLPLRPEDLAKIPDNSHSFYFSATSYGNNLSRTLLTFGDSYRYAEIAGLNHNHVTGFLSIITDKVQQHEVTYGGEAFRILLGIGFFALLLLGHLAVTWRYNNPKVFAGSLFLLVVIQNGVTWLFPWKNVFPGTLITLEALGYLQEYAHIFTFLGFLLGVVALALPVIQIRANKRLKGTGDPHGDSSDA